MPEQAKPVLKAVGHPSKDIKQEQKTVRSIAPTKTEDISATTTTKKMGAAKDSSKLSLDSAVKQLNSYVQSVNRNLEFKIDKDSGRIVVKVIDAETDELIRQIPNEEALNIAKQLDQGLMGNNADSGIFLIKERA